VLLKALSAAHGRAALTGCHVLGKHHGVRAVAFVGYREQHHYKQIQEIISVGLINEAQESLRELFAPAGCTVAKASR